MRTGGVRQIGLYSALGCLLSAAACGQLIGIEDVQNGGAAGGPGAGGTKGGSANSAGGEATTGGKNALGGAAQQGGGPSAGGSSNQGGRTNAGGAANQGGSAPRGGGPASGGQGPSDGGVGGEESGGAETSGGSSHGGAPSGGAPNGGGGGAGSTTVTGKVIDALGHALANVPVTLGADTVLTDNSGKFSVPNVPATYDVSFVVEPGRGGFKTSYAWVYQGLTRRDPTLQVYRGLQDHDCEMDVTTSGLVTDQPAWLALGSPDGAYAQDDIRNGEVDYLSGHSWFGPTQTATHYHALNWKADANGLPTEYGSHLTGTFDAVADSKIPLSLTFTSGPLATTSVSGQVSSATTQSRQNYLFARFADNAAIRLASVTPSSASFSFLLPQLSGASFSVAAADGDSYYGPFGLVHQMVNGGQTNVQLNIPVPPTLVSPADGATGVGAATSFQWAGSNSVVVLHAESKNYYQGMFIVTAAKKVSLPNIAGDFFLRKDEIFTWQIEVHDSYASVDDATSTGGFLDSFSWNGDLPYIYRANDSGTYAASAKRGFKTAP